jgi:curved DNA-binding protein CbpA
MFIDYYEALEISPKANSETIERVFRHLAMRYHPDNQDTGDASRFNEIVEAHNVLKDPTTRAQYDLRHREQSGVRATIAGDAGDAKGFDRDLLVQEKVLSILYVKRRRDMNDPGIAAMQLEGLADCPREHLEFHIWYLKAKGWIGQENGMLFITPQGVDHLSSMRISEPTTKQLTYRNVA